MRTESFIIETSLWHHRSAKSFIIETIGLQCVQRALLYTIIVSGKIGLLQCVQRALL